MSNRTPNRFRRRAIAVTALLGFCALGTGCVHRRMTVESNPAGALVVVDGEEVGLTPVSLDFTYYGTRDVTLIKDGYQTKTVAAKLRTPWYQVPPLDFISDNFLPYQVTNRHRFRVDLQPRHPADANHDDLLNRGNSFRTRALVSD